jgi:hypothetical protein
VTYTIDLGKKTIKDINNIKIDINSAILRPE